MRFWPTSILVVFEAFGTIFRRTTLFLDPTDETSVDLAGSGTSAARRLKMLIERPTSLFFLTHRLYLERATLNDLRQVGLKVGLTRV